MPTNQYNTQARQQVSNQPKWYQYISPYIEGASKAMGDINKRKEAYMKAFKDYMAETAEQAKNYGSNAKKQIEYYTPIVKNRAEEYVREGVDTAKEYVSNTWDNVKNYDYSNLPKDIGKFYDENMPSWLRYDAPPAEAPHKPARPYRRETLPDPIWNTGGIGHSLLQPIMTELKDDAINKWAYVKPMNAMGFTPQARTLTNRDFGEPMKRFVDSVNVATFDRLYPTWREMTANGDTVRVLVKGSDYSPNYGGRSKGIPYMIMNPQGQAEYTLGSWTAEATADDITTKDVYDFRDINMLPGTVYAWWRSNAVPVLNTMEDQPENEKLKIEIKRKRIPEWVHKLLGNELAPPYKK